MSKYIISFGFILILICTASSFAESLWTAPSGSMFSDLRARQVGDLVTIVIVESTSSSLAASSAFDKKLDHSNAAGVGPLLKLLPEMSVSSGQKGGSAGSTTMNSKLVTTITAKVTRTLPNGNLVIQATRSVVTNNERQEITLTGSLRPQDVDGNNRALSTSISDAKIVYEGKGPVGDRQREGIISKLIKFIF